MIPVMFPPFYDELLYGYFLRLSDANGMDIKEFIPQYLENNNYNFNKKNYIRYDYPLDARYIKIQHHNYLGKNIVCLVKRNTLVLSLFPFLHEGEQVSLIHDIMNPYIGDKFLPTHRVQLATGLNICTHCINEDYLNNIEPYIRVWHQLDGITTCAIHGTPLLKMGTNSSHSLTTNMTNAQTYHNIKKNIPIGYNDQKIALFLKEMHETPINIDRSILTEVIRSKMLELNITITKPYIGLKQLCKSKGFDNYFKSDIELFVKNIILKNKGTTESLLYFTVMLFDNYSNFYTYANNYKKVSYLSIPETSFEIISEHKQLLELKCKKCGAGFIEHYEFLKYGFGCINCNKTFTPTEFVQNQLNMVTHNEYKLLSPFQGYYSKHILFHNICGKPTKISLSERLFENRECSCKLSSTIDSIQDIINEKTDEFEVINTFKQKGNKFITIKHRKCKNVFSIKTSNFYRTPKCKYCK